MRTEVLLLGPRVGGLADVAHRGEHSKPGQLRLGSSLLQVRMFIAAVVANGYTP